MLPRGTTTSSIRTTLHRPTDMPATHTHTHTERATIYYMYALCMRTYIPVPLPLVWLRMLTSAHVLTLNGTMVELLMPSTNGIGYSLLGMSAAPATLYVDYQVLWLNVSCHDRVPGITHSNNTAVSSFTFSQ